MLIVQKFGGTSLADSQKLRNAALRTARLLEQGYQVLTVVSAQGHTTDRLIREAEEIDPQGSAREMDAYLAAGEQMSAGLLAMAIGALGCGAVSLTGWQAGIITDGTHASSFFRIP